MHFHNNECMVTHNILVSLSPDNTMPSVPEVKEKPDKCPRGTEAQQPPAINSEAQQPPAVNSDPFCLNFSASSMSSKRCMAELMCAYTLKMAARGLHPPCQVSCCIFSVLDNDWLNGMALTWLLVYDLYLFTQFSFTFCCRITLTWIPV